MVIKAPGWVRLDSMTDSKFASLQTLLQAAYDFYDQTSKSEIDAAVNARTEKELEDVGPSVGFSAVGFRDMVMYDQIVQESIKRRAFESGVSEEDFESAMKWLIARGLLAYTNGWKPVTVQLTTLGEDLIDLDISVEEWYCGPYRQRLLTNAPVDPNLENEER